MRHKAPDRYYCSFVILNDLSLPFAFPAELHEKNRPLGTRGEMAHDEQSPLLHAENGQAKHADRRLSKLMQQDEEASSIIKSHVTVDEQKMGDSAVGERLAYNDYTTIDWLHDLVRSGNRSGDVGGSY